MPRPQPRPALAKAPVRDHPVAPTPDPTSNAPSTAADTDPMVLMSTRLRRSTQRRLKIYAATTDQPIQVIVEALINDLLDRQQVS
jgi:hypothetical protein